MRWFFLSDRQETIPTSEDQLSALAATGKLRPNSLVWHEGMADWVSASELKPQLFARDAAITTQSQLASLRRSQRIGEGLARRTGWIVFSSVIMMLAALLGIPALIYKLVQTLRLKEFSATLGEEAKRLLLETTNAATLTFSPTALILVTVTQCIALIFLFFMGFHLMRGSLMVRRGNSLGDAGDVEEGLQKLGSGHLFLALGLLSLIIGYGILFILQIAGALVLVTVAT